MTGICPNCGEPEGEGPLAGHYDYHDNRYVCMRLELACKLNVDSPTLPPSNDERRQCGCEDCMGELTNRKLVNDFDVSKIIPSDPLERAIVCYRNRASVAERQGFTSYAKDLNACADAIEQQQKELKELKEAIKRGIGTYVVDGGDLYDHGWKRISDANQEKWEVQKRLEAAEYERDMARTEAKQSRANWIGAANDVAALTGDLLNLRTKLSEVKTTCEKMSAALDQISHADDDIIRGENQEPELQKRLNRCVALAEKLTNENIS